MSFGGANTAQAEHWNGAEGDHWSIHHDRYNAMLGPFGAHALDAAAIAPGEAVLDVGCGCGDTAIAAAHQTGPAGMVAGIDLSGQMIDRARSRVAETGLGNLAFVQGDAQTHPFDETSMDVMISRLGVMFFDDPTAAFTNIARAIRLGGRLAFVCWQDPGANDWMVVPAMAALAHVPPPDLTGGSMGNPFEFADVDHVTEILSDAGFSNVAARGVRQAMLVGGGGTLDDAIEFFRHGSIGQALLSGAEPDATERAVAAVTEAYAAHMAGDGVKLDASIWVVTATRV